MSNLSLNETEAARVASKHGGRRVSLSDIEANIADRLFFTGDQALNADVCLGTTDHNVVMSLSLLTVCILVLRNGFTVIGKSAPADPKNFDPELGRKFALEDAMRQCWPLMGYHLRQTLWEHDALGADQPPSGVGSSPGGDFPLDQPYKSSTCNMGTGEVRPDGLRGTPDDPHKAPF